jgi:hypothetical protein
MKAKTKAPSLKSNFDVGGSFTLGKELLHQEFGRDAARIYREPVLQVNFRRKLGQTSGAEACAHIGP